MTTTQWCSPDVLARLPNNMLRTGYHARCQRLVSNCTCACHDPAQDVPGTHLTAVTEETPVTTTAAPEHPPLALDPTEAVNDAHRAAQALDMAMLGYAPDDWTDAVRLLRNLRDVLETLKRIDSDLTRFIYLHGEHGAHQQIDGVMGEVTVTRGRAKERWDGEEAVTEYVGRMIRDMGGEAPEPEVVAQWVLRVVPARALRVTPLREAGMDVDLYRESEPGTLRVDFTRPA